MQTYKVTILLEQINLIPSSTYNIRRIIIFNDVEEVVEY